MSSCPASIRIILKCGKSLLPFIVLAGLASCSTATTINKEGDKVTSGYGNRTVVTFYADGRREVRVEPIRFMEAALSGGISGFVQGILASSKQTEKP